MADSPRDCFLKSLSRCTQNDDFIPVFYNHFLSTSDEIREKFKNTDFEKQNQMLLRSLRLAAGATTGEVESLREMRERAETHDRHHLNIEPHLYDDWLASVIKAASECDPEWDASIDEGWRKVLGHVIKHMTKYY